MTSLTLTRSFSACLEPAEVERPSTICLQHETSLSMMCRYSFASGGMAPPAPGHVVGLEAGLSARRDHRGGLLIVHDAGGG
jgi:hypothetical protein